MSTQYLFVAAIKAALLELQIDSAKLQVQTQIMDQSLAVKLWQLCYGKINFVVLVPDVIRGHVMSRRMNRSLRHPSLLPSKRKNASKQKKCVNMQIIAELMSSSSAVSTEH